MVVQHLDPEYESKLPQLLGRATSLPVLEIVNTLASNRLTGCKPLRAKRSLLLRESAKHDSMSRSAVAAGELTAGCAGKIAKELARIAEHLYVALTSLFHTLYFDSPAVIGVGVTLERPPRVAYDLSTISLFVIPMEIKTRLS
jgi:hypothetical protein